MPRWPNYQRRSAQDGEVGGGNPSRGTISDWSNGNGLLNPGRVVFSPSIHHSSNPSPQFWDAHVVQRRDSALKTRKVSVQIRPWAPSARSPMKRRPAQDGKVASASPATRTISGMPTGQASRASVLTSACPIRACGASPRHSASLCRRPPLRA